MSIALRRKEQCFDLHSKFNCAPFHPLLEVEEAPMGILFIFI
jgi:hypothetical protein